MNSLILTPEQEILNLSNLMTDFLQNKIDRFNFIKKVNKITSDLNSYICLIQKNKKSMILTNPNTFNSLKNNIEKIVAEISIKKDYNTLDFFYNTTIFKNYIKQHFYKMFKLSPIKTFFNQYSLYDHFFISFCIKKNISLNYIDIGITNLKFLDRHNLLKDKHIEDIFNPLFSDTNIHNKIKKWIIFVDKLHAVSGGKVYNYDFLCKYITKIYGYSTYQKFINTVRLTEKELYDKGLNSSNLIKEINYFKKGNSHLKPLFDIKFHNEDLNIYLESKHNFYDMCYEDYILYHNPSLLKYFKGITEQSQRDKENDYLNKDQQKNIKNIIEYWDINIDNLSKEYISVDDYFLNNYQDDLLFKKIKEISYDIENLKSKDFYKNDIELFKSKLFLANQKNFTYLCCKTDNIDIIVDKIENRILIKAPKKKINSIIHEYNKIKRSPLLLKRSNILILKFNNDSYDLINKYVKTIN